MRDPYEVLGVSRNASQDEVKKAYRKLAKELHPDLHPGDVSVETRFKEVSAAYHLLGDAKQRARFDRGEIDAGGTENPQQNFYRSHANAAAGAKYRERFGDAGGADLGGIFDELFGGARASAQRRGGDLTLSLRVDFLDAAKGAKRRLQRPDGKAIDLSIPAGTADGQTLRLKGQGMPGKGGGSPGDAYVEIRVAPHAYFQRKDNDIHLELPVTLREAVLGAKIEIPTIDGKVALTVPKGSNTGTTLRLKGKGMADARKKSRGDHYVRLKVVLPDEPDSALEEFVADWNCPDGDEMRAKAGMA